MSENGAVLRAKNKGVDLETFSEKYDEESIDMLSNRRMSDGSYCDVRSAISSSSRTERRVLRERAEISRTVLKNKVENWDVDVMRDRSCHEIEFEKMNQDYEGLMMYERDKVGDDRAELLRQLDDLKYKLSQADNSYGKAPLDRMMSHENHVVYEEPPPLMHRQEMGESGFYGYGKPSRSQRGYLGAQASFQMPPARAYTSGPIIDKHTPYMEPYPPNNTRHHHPSCSCYRCQQFSDPIMLPAYIGQYSNLSDDMVSRVQEPPPSRDHSVKSHERWASDVNSEVDGFILRRPPRPHLAAGVKHLCPIAGGAPFLTCSICYQLLLLPKKVVNKNGTRKKLKCGACSSVIPFADKGLVLSSEVEAKISTVKLENVPSSQASQTRTTFSSQDYDDSGYDFHSMDREAALAKEEGAAVKDTNSADHAREGKRAATPAGSTLQDYFEYSNKFRMAQKSEEGNRAGGLKEFVRKDSAATEIDVSSSNEFFNTGSTFESGSRGGGSFVAGIMGTLNESHRSEEESVNGSVTVNGHLISDRLVKKAERLAGPIQPGHYWYDFRAGFWGAMGGPCLGIIPPFIEEFNYPMQENCAGGNTHILVNGRELNQKDLNLLGSRGLPRERDRSYIVEISGRVLDDETGQELESLGKLAPTMERAKRGFGMRVPQAVA